MVYIVVIITIMTQTYGDTGHSIGGTNYHMFIHFYPQILHIVNFDGDFLGDPSKLLAKNN